MQIIIVSPSLDPQKNISGISSVTQFIIDNNHEHEYIHFELGRRDNERGGVFRIRAIWRSLKQWKRLLKMYPEATIHYNFPLEKASILRDPLFMRIAYREKRRMVVHLHGGSYLTRKKIPFPFGNITHSIFKWNVPFIALSELEADIVRQNFGAKKVHTLPNCISLSDAKTFNKSNNEKKCLTIGYLGRIAETKGMSYLLEACKELKRQNIPFKLKIAGAEEVQNQYLPQFRSVIDTEFEYCGLVSGNKKTNFLKELDVFVLPTFFEGLPMSLLECMSYGAVPVTTPVGSIPAIVHENQNGLYLKIKDSQSIVSKITYLHTNRYVWQGLSQAARKSIFDRFDPVKYTTKLNQIYRIS